MRRQIHSFRATGCQISEGHSFHGVITSLCSVKFHLLPLHDYSQAQCANDTANAKNWALNPSFLSKMSSRLEMKFHIPWCLLFVGLFFIFTLLNHYGRLTQKPVAIMFIFRYSWSPTDVDIWITIHFFWKGIPPKHFFTDSFQLSVIKASIFWLLTCFHGLKENLKIVIWKCSQDQLSPVSLLFTVLASKVLGSKIFQLMIHGC